MDAAEQVLVKVAADPHHAKEIDRVESEFGTGKMVCLLLAPVFISSFR